MMASEGIEKGIEIGLEKGLRKGIEKGKIEVARNLLDVLDNETIAVKTGLSISQINELRRMI